MSNTLIDKIGILEPNEKNFDKHLKAENKLVSEGETNWYKVLTSVTFLYRLIIVIIFTLVGTLVLCNITLNPDSKSWYNQLAKPDWMPDGITVAVIFIFIQILMLWTWYRFATVINKWWCDVLFLVIFGLQVAWVIVQYRAENLSVGRILACVLLAAVVILFVISIYYIGFGDTSLFSLIYVGWMILVVLFSFGMKNLDKEYKILGVVKDVKSSLYKRKMKLEIVEGIKIDENGNRTFAAPEEQD